MLHGNKLFINRHSDVVGNEEADRLAVADSEQRLDDDSMNLVGMPILTVKTRLETLGLTAMY